MAEELVKKKLELLSVQKAKADRINELLNGAALSPSLMHGFVIHHDPSGACMNLSYLTIHPSNFAGPGGFNEASRKTCKNLEAAITVSKQPGYFAYYEQPDHLTDVVRSGEVERLQEQVVQLQKQIDQLSDKIEALHSAASGSSDQPAGAGSPSVHNLKQWFATYGSPKQTEGGSSSNADLYTNFTPNKKVYGGTSHYSAFRSQSSTMKKGRLTK